MLIIKLFGGLGNQLFQYAFGRHLAIKNNIPLVLDTVTGFQGDFYKRTYSLAPFHIQAKIADAKTVEKLRYLQNPQGRKERLKGWINKYLLQFNPLFINEQQFHFNSKVLDTKTSLGYINGYWQTERYFKSIESIIRQDLTFVNPISPSNLALKEAIQGSNSVCLHIRRLLGIADGQINEEGIKFHGSVGLNYYDRALDLLSRKERDLHFFIFADDPKWAKENINLPYNTTFVEGNTDYEDLQLMSLCKHNIIANSSFSWWAAWLNSNPHKTVIMPTQWFADTSVNTSNVKPDNWLSI